MSYAARCFCFSSKKSGAGTHLLHDVDLAAKGPVLLLHAPDGRPRTAAAGRMRHVDDHQSISVEGLCSEAQALARRIADGLGLDAEPQAAVAARLEHAVRACRRRIDILDEAARLVVARVRVPPAEKLGRRTPHRHGPVRQR